MNEIVATDDILPSEETQDATWWFNMFNGFDTEVYILFEYLCYLEKNNVDEVDQEFMSYLRTKLTEKQNKMIKAFEVGGRENPFDEEVPFDDFIYWSSKKDIEVE